MIFDRTQNDVDTAIRLRNEKVKFDPITMQPINPEALTESEIATLEKGTITYNTLNRIESKQEELKNLFDEMFYFVKNITIKHWNNTDIFLQEDFDRIIQNNELLKKAFFVYANTPKEQDRNFTKYESINIVEKILHDLDVMINDIKSHYRVCGVAVCGE